jgi:AraC family ethanolamine operon transcriptional activator
MAIDPGRITFVVCFSPNSFCGLEVSAGSMLIFGPGREYRSILPEGFESFEVCASIDFLRAKGLDIAEFHFADFHPENCVINIDDLTLRQFRRLLTILNVVGAAGLEPTDKLEWARAVRDRAMSLIVRVLKASNRQKCSSFTKSTPRWPLAAKVLDEIDLSESSTPSIDDVCQSLGCSRRAVQAAFRNTLGISPSQYVLALRLQRARRSLLEAAPDAASVTSISADHEFLHFGRFAQYYKLMFGERPSDTLKRKYKLRADMR